MLDVVIQAWLSLGSTTAFLLASILSPNSNSIPTNQNRSQTGILENTFAVEAGNMCKFPHPRGPYILNP